MKSYKYILYIVFALAACFATGCQSEDLTDPTQDGEILVSFRPELAADMSSRAIADGSGIDRVLVVVYENEVEKIRQEIVRTNGSFTNVSLRLLNGHKYQVLFWGYNSNCKAYQVNDNGTISADYTDYLGGGFSKMEELDAFYCVKTVTVGEDYDNSATLYRAVAQLNFADNTEAALDGATATLSLTGIATSIDMLASTPKGANTPNAIEFSFNDFPAEELNGNHYIASVYLLPTVEPITADYSISTGLEVNGITDIKLEANKRTNVIGSIVESPSSEWGGEISEIQLVNDIYIIDTPEKLAYMQEPHQELESGKTFRVTKSFDMGNIPMTSLVVPDNSTFECEGNTISNLNIDGGLFGNATNLKVNNLKLENITITPATDLTHVGALVNILKGSSSFNNVIVNNATVTTTNGAAGGIVGYITRDTKTLLSADQEILFDGCQVNGTTISGSKSEGYYVGLLCGYEKKEKLTFTSSCSVGAGTKLADFTTSRYVEGNEGEWLAANDYTKFNGWLGEEEYFRGKLTFGGNDFCPKWDGTTKIQPLTENSATSIYSAFDCAWLQGGSHTAVTFKENVDLGGDKKSKNLFNPISSIKTLDGENNKLYNLNIFSKNWKVGFIIDTTGGPTHKNLHFVNSSVRAEMAGNETTVYVGTLCPYIQHQYVVDNVTVTNGYVLGLNKIGGLIGFVTSEGPASLNCNNCKVVGTTIENIESTTTDRFGNNYVHADFYPQGEVGGLIGFIANDVIVTNCSVNNCDINCYGQDMKKTNMLNFKVPGRHVNRFIGDIRTVNGDVITINNCSAENNRFGKRAEDTQYSDFKLVGRCYYIAIGISWPTTIGVFDTKGKMVVDSKEYAPSKNNGNLTK